MVPPSSWVLLIIATLLYFFGGNPDQFMAYVGFNMVLFLLLSKVSVLAHESGHLLCAKIVGAKPKRMVLGKGYKIFSAKWLGIKIILNSKFSMGLATAAFKNLKFIRLKLLFYYLGGVLVNFLIAGIMYLLFDFNFNVVDEINLPSLILFTNLLLGIFALIPYKIRSEGRKLSSDGLSVLKLPFYKTAELEKLALAEDYLDAYDYMEEKQYEKALAIYQGMEPSPLIANDKAIAHIKMGRYQQALNIMEELLPFSEEILKGKQAPILHNSLAWLYLLLNRPEEADHYSGLAYRENTSLEPIRGTRASALIETGRYEEGIKLIKNDCDFNYPTSHTLSAAMYLALAYHQLGTTEKIAKYIAFVDEHLELLDTDEKLLYQRILDRINTSKTTGKETE